MRVALIRLNTPNMGIFVKL
jgi:hypothetical protein